MKEEEGPSKYSVVYFRTCCTNPCSVRWRVDVDLQHHLQVQGRTSLS